MLNVRFRFRVRPARRARPADGLAFGGGLFRVFRVFRGSSIGGKPFPVFPVFLGSALGGLAFRVFRVFRGCIRRRRRAGNVRHRDRGGGEDELVDLLLHVVPQVVAVGRDLREREREGEDGDDGEHRHERERRGAQRDLVPPEPAPDEVDGADEPDEEAVQAAQGGDLDVPDVARGERRGAAQPALRGRGPLGGLRGGRLRLAGRGLCLGGGGLGLVGRRLRLGGRGLGLVGNLANLVRRVGEFAHLSVSRRGSRGAGIIIVTARIRVKPKMSPGRRHFSRGAMAVYPPFRGNTPAKRHQTPPEQKGQSQ